LKRIEGFNADLSANQNRIQTDHGIISNEFSVDKITFCPILSI